MRRERETLVLALFRWIKGVIIGGIIVVIGGTYLYQKGVFNDPFWTNAKNDIVNSELFTFFKGEGTSLFNNASETLNSVADSATSSSEEVNTDTSSSASTEVSETENTTNAELSYTPLAFTGELQLELGEYDSLGRATYGHIQLKDSQEPSDKRESKITYNPVGWHNYKFDYIDAESGETKQSWLMNRGHLIGYQFSGLNSEGKNLVPMTRYLNAGTISDKKMDDSNPYSMLFYENALDKWLADNPKYYLDYEVIPNYTDDELVPRTVTLYWTGFDSKGNQIKVSLEDEGKSSTSNLVSSVTLKNASDNAVINYRTGTAIQK